MKEIIIQENDAGQRLDRYLAKTFPALTKGAMHRAIRNKKIKINRKRTSHDYRLEAGDQLLLFLPPDLVEEAQRSIGYPGKLYIIYEDENLLIVNKPAGLLSQKDQAADQDTLNDRILHYLYTTKAWQPEKDKSFVPGIAHRLDRNTSGLVIAAKTALAAREVADAIASHRIQKSYRALVDGDIKEDQNLDLYLKKDGLKAVVCDPKDENAARAITHMKVLKHSPGQSLVLLDLETGRFHQIRASMAHIGHPLIADVKYGYKGKQKEMKLQAYKLDLSDLKLDVPLRQTVFELPEIF